MEVTGIVKDGRVELPTSVRPPEGAAVRVSWDEPSEGYGPPIERKPVRVSDVEEDIAWAFRKRPRT